MNRVILMGRLTRDPEVRYTSGENSMAVARYTLAIDRAIKKQGEQSADFINCVAFSKAAEFAEKYSHLSTFHKDFSHLYSQKITYELWTTL